jgi:hypothetical protein
MQGKSAESLSREVKEYTPAWQTRDVGFALSRFNAYVRDFNDGCHALHKALDFGRLPALVVIPDFAFKRQPRWNRQMKPAEPDEHDQRRDEQRISFGSQIR